MTIDEYNKSVDLYSDRIYRFVLKNCRDIHFSQDIVQDCYEKLWKKLDTVNFQKVRSYLFSTAYHTLIDRIRKENKMSSTEETYFPEPPVESHYSDLSEILDEAVKKLPEIQRLVLLLRDFEGYSYNEIGEIASLNESQVKVYIYRARLFLKNYIGKIDILV